LLIETSLQYLVQIAFEMFLLTSAFLSFLIKIEVLSSLIADEEIVGTYQLRNVKAVDLTNIFGHNCP